MDKEQKRTLENNTLKRLPKTDKNIPKINRNKKKSRKKSQKKLSKISPKIVPLLKSPSKSRKFSKGKYLKTEEKTNNQSGIIWDNKTIDEQILERKLHPRKKIDEPKTPYPEVDETDLYQDGINKLNEIKPTDELLNDVVNSLMERNNKQINRSKTNELKKKAYENEYTNALIFFKENKEKFEELDGERKLSLQNTFINKFQKEVRSLSQEKYKHEGL